MDKKNQGLPEKANTHVKVSKKAVDLFENKTPQSKKPIIDVNQQTPSSFQDQEEVPEER